MPILLENHATRILMPKAKSNLNSMSSLAFCMDVEQDRAASKADRCHIVSTLNTWRRCIQMPSTLHILYLDLVHRRWRKRIIDHGYVTWAVQQRWSTFCYQRMRLLTKEHNKLLCSLELSDTSHWNMKYKMECFLTLNSAYLVHYTQFKALCIIR